MAPPAILRRIDITETRSAPGAETPPDEPEATTLFINRELSWLAFNERVLQYSLDGRNPLLERLRFIAIVSMNLDEFYMVRVAGLRRQVASGVTSAPPDGLSPIAQLEAIERRVVPLLARQRACLEDDLLPALAAHGIRIVSAEDLDQGEVAYVDELFESQIFPVLTPLAVDPSHPFPYISNLSLSLAVDIRDVEGHSDRFARVKVPKSLPRWIRLPDSLRFIPLEEVIGAHLLDLFPGMAILGWYPFRVTRYSDIDFAGVAEPDDLLETIQEQVFRRRFGEVVRIEISPELPAHLRSLLFAELREERRADPGLLAEPNVHQTGAILELSDLMEIASLEIPELRDRPLVPKVPERLRDDSRSIFDVIKERDVLLHHPFDSFSSVERFFESAATDPEVLAVKTTLYRTTGDTGIVRALMEAAQRGKQVAVLIELKARFDEENNIGWARMLESYGVHVAYGSAELKTHAKVALVVRREPDGIRRYVHIGTGNYNSRIARLYTDLGLFTAREDIGADVSDLFNSLTGFSGHRTYKKLIVAPANMRDQFLALIDRETLIARAGRPARIVAKVNALVDQEMIESLYRASQAGVQVDLLVRGICCLRPGLPGISDRIRVVSIVGRFLEHSRLWYFHNDADPGFYVGSADWMPRNLDRRVEAVAPVEDERLHADLRSLIDVCLADDVQAWDLQTGGSWRQRRPAGLIDHATHTILLEDSWGRSVAPSSASANTD